MKRFWLQFGLSVAATCASASSVYDRVEYDVYQFDPAPRLALLKTMLVGLDSLTDIERASLEIKPSDDGWLTVGMPDAYQHLRVSEPSEGPFRLHRAHDDGIRASIAGGLILSLVADYGGPKLTLNPAGMTAVTRILDQAKPERLVGFQRFALAQDTVHRLALLEYAPGVLALLERLLRLDDPMAYFWRDDLRTRSKALHSVERALDVIGWAREERVVFNALLVQIATALRVPGWGTSEYVARAAQTQLVAFAPLVRRLHASRVLAFGLDEPEGTPRRELARRLDPALSHLSRAIDHLADQLPPEPEHVANTARAAERVREVIVNSAYYKSITRPCELMLAGA